MSTMTPPAAVEGLDAALQGLVIMTAAWTLMAASQ
jgi:hypothetical protein